RALAVTAAKLHPIAPCGACRQVLHEFADGDCPVASDAADGRLVVTTAGALLPGAFTFPRGG
ncbi:MAG TPA: cytidine deaminase, partial [Burkholderiaceae bacterium]